VNPIPLEACPDEMGVQLESAPYTHAAVAKFERPEDKDLIKTLEQSNIYLNDSGPVTSESVILKGTHPLLGMNIIPDTDDPTRPCLTNWTQSTPMSATPRWRSRLCGAHVRSVNDIPVHSITDIKTIISEQQ
jgi:hypothetical protein